MNGIRYLIILVSVILTIVNITLCAIAYNQQRFILISLITIICTAIALTMSTEKYDKFVLLIFYIAQMGILVIPLIV